MKTKCFMKYLRMMKILMINQNILIIKWRWKIRKIKTLKRRNDY